MICDHHDNYFYSQQSNQFAFYRIPKALFSDDHYNGLSAEAKVLYGILLDRMELSAKNGWMDDSGRVYIIFTIEEIMSNLGCANKKAIALLSELEKKAGLIERKRQGLGKPNLIYVKNFVSPAGHIRKCENDTSGNGVLTFAEMAEAHSNHTDTNKTDFSDTEIPSYPDGKEGRSEKHSYDSYLWDALEMDALLNDSPADRDLIMELYGLVSDTVHSRRRTIRIGGDDKPFAVVRAQFMKLTRDHLVYVLESMKSNTTLVRDMKQYLLTALYNAPLTLNSHYASRVSHDFAAEGFSVSRREDPLPSWYKDYSYNENESL